VRETVVSDGLATFAIEERIFNITKRAVVYEHMSQAKNPIRSIEKTLAILEALRDLEGAGVTELATTLGFTKATVHHHLSTLEEHEYVVRRDGTYHLGIVFFELGEFVRRQRRICAVARPEIDALAEETGEIANLMIEEHGRGVYLYIARGPRAVNLDTRVGTRQYLHTSALGKSILAHCPPERVEAIVDRHGLSQSTANTVTDRDDLRRELDEIANRGVAFDGEERAQAIKCVAAPVVDNAGELLGAVSVSAPSNRMRGVRFREEVPELVRDAATIIGINMSYSP
jgi:DNA-binding IclR family transcriptional regulator